ncbi:hypothetical protein [Paraburkholderia sp. J12]|uniref:hypothetical protein n=1 Tax=Paraburkholderia sp. J12 TaxID=2805432 RepID=UPI002ABD881F|nr:hypothetical protein [Paraburkholderia sp. J12]
MGEPSDNTRRALRGHLWHLLELLDKMHRICEADGSGNTRVNYRHRPDGQKRDDVESFLVDFRQEVSRAAARWGILLEGDEIDAMHALIVTLQFVGITLEEMSPTRLSGFGALDPAFEKEYAAFLRRLHDSADLLLQRLLAGDNAGTPSSR